MVDIFTKPLGLDKLRQFSGMLGLHHLNLPNLRGRVEERLDERAESIDESELDKRTSKPKPAKHRGRMREKKVEKSWSEIAKSQTKDELEMANLVNGGEELETTNLEKVFDSDKQNHMKAKKIS